MPKFRLKTPRRRKESRETNQYQDHKDDLKEDFNHRCGYCDAPDKWRDTYYEIDHFVPKTFLKTIGIAEYSNLVYSCRYCNNAKSNTWPTGNEKVHNDGEQGFIDPCNHTYDKCFERDENGFIRPRGNELSRYIYKALRLDHRRHANYWILEKLESTLLKIEGYVSKADSELLTSELFRRYATISSEYRERRDKLHVGEQ